MQKNSPSRIICANGNKTQVKWSPKLAYLLESRTMRVVVLGSVVIDILWQLGHCTVSGVTV